MALQRIVSGGQTGADRAALEAALRLGLATGGFVPKGRLAEDGVIPDRFAGLEETESADPAERTRRNVIASDATLVLHLGRMDKGTGLTLELAEILSRPCLALDLRQARGAAGLQKTIAALHRFLQENAVQGLNVAGPRESKAPGLHATAEAFLTEALAAVPEGQIAPLDAAERQAQLEGGLTSLRHWDGVRWLVPFWYLTASGTAAAEMDKLAQGPAIAVALGLFLAGLAALHLVGRTIVYNNEQIARLRAIGAGLHAHRIATIRFRLAGWRTPATLIFMLLMAAATAAWLGWLICHAKG